MCSHDKEDLSSWQEWYLCSDGFNILKLLRKCPGQRGNNVSRVWSFSQYNILSIWNNGGESGKLFWISNPRQLAGRTCLLDLDQQNSIIGNFLLAILQWYWTQWLDVITLQLSDLAIATSTMTQWYLQWCSSAVVLHNDTMIFQCQLLVNILNEESGQESTQGLALWRWVGLMKVKDDDWFEILIRQR